MTKAEYDSYRRRLRALQEQLRQRLSHLTTEAVHAEAETNLSHVPIHLADLGSEQYEHDMTLNLWSTERSLLGEIQQALQRLESGTYGICEECQQPIPRERLRELPYTRYCVTCARQQEAEQTT